MSVLALRAATSDEECLRILERMIVRGTGGVDLVREVHAQAVKRPRIYEELTRIELRLLHESR